ncbi:GmrSD restriction endonuclease domain-containing protein [Streptomyces sp. GSL17-111]|uniref:GmrSD restriction endonuclease domain-containing protein n=1 Tax=Streptomyces sp. GSL17-111 TaxID=3121596 RepID=UPI0030F3FE9D
MRAQEITFLKLVQGEKQFQVPLYQRTYSWGREQLQRLWDDITELVEQQLSGQSPAPHFLGSVVLAPGRLQAGGVQRWLVVDGQQRLTTLMLLVTALRDHLKEAGDDRAVDRVHRQLLVNEFHEGYDHYRLLPTQADRDAYTACVEATPLAGGADNIGAAYRYFRGVLAEGATERDETWSGAVETVLKDLLSIVEITAERGDNVYRIFESINNTGVGLSQSDLLRNYLFMLLPQRGERVYHELWLPMQQQLGPKNLELLVWLDLVVRGNERAKQGDIYREQQKRLEPLAKDEAALQQEIAQLAERGQRLLRILEPHREPSAPLRTALERLAAWGGQTHYPLALHLLNLIDAGSTTPEEVAEALGYVESYLVRRLICQTPTTGLNRIFMEAPRGLEQDRSPAEAVRRFLSGRRRRWPSDEELREAIASKPFYWSGRPIQRTYILRRLEESYASAEPVDFTQASLTLEHILPQRPAQAWFELLAEETEDGQTPQELYDLLVHTLGNLTLSGENSKLSNHPFRRKQAILDSSALHMNQEIAASGDRWGKKEILERAGRLTERAVRLWPGPIGAVASVTEESPDWADLRAALVAMPSGTWTTYGDIAELIGRHPLVVGNYLANTPGVLGAYRVLTSDGKVSPGFRWPEGGRTDPPQQILESEGVSFNSTGRADRSHRLDAADLATLLGKDVQQETVHDPLPEAENAEAARRFEAQLKEHHPDAVDGVLTALDFWRRQGGYLNYGRHEETSCFPVLDAGTARQPHDLWPLALYPVSGTAEVVFQALKTRSPFDDTEQRRELLRRLNEIDGIELAEAKLELRPSFSLHVFAEHGEEISAVLEWFVHTAALDLARRG